MSNRVLNGKIRLATLVLLALAFSSELSLAERLVDPSKVAPEFREAAEKRRAEQLRLLDCNNAARIANVPARDSTKFIADCIDKPVGTPSDISATKR